MEMKLGKFSKIVSWAVGAVLVSAGVAWAATLWRVDSYGNIRAARSTVLLSAGQTSNCKLAISGSTLSVVGTNDAALSATNPCRVGLNNGKVATFTAPVSVTFGASSDTDGNLFGIIDANWTNLQPFIIGVITDGSSSYITISRVAHSVSGSNATDLCQKNDTDCDAQGDDMILTSGLTLANWTLKEITPVGWFSATYATASSAWTFSIPQAAGFNRALKEKSWATEAGQMGAVSGRYCYIVSGTCPQYSDNRSAFMTDMDGWVYVTGIFSGDGGDEGAGSNALVFTAPYFASKMNGSNVDYWGGGFRRNGSGIEIMAVAIPAASTAAADVFLYSTFTAAGANVTGDQQNHTIRSINYSLRYFAGR